MTARLALLAVGVLVASGCASSEKLARRSQEQLAAGDVRKAYETALKAVQKDPFNQGALVALHDAGDAVLGHETRRMRSLAQTADTLGAADVALGMEFLRREVADFGVVLASDGRAKEEERRIRAAAAATIAREGDERFEAGAPKEASRSYAQAAAYDPSDEALQDQLRLAREEATDRVLLLPYACDTRGGLDGRQLSLDMYADVSRFADSRLEFTELFEPGELWGRAFGHGGEWTREAAYRAGEERKATRVAWARLHGDHLERQVEIFDAVLYRQVTSARPEGGTVTRWLEVPVHVRIEDLWTSVAVECEVHELEPRGLVARRANECGAGMRTVFVSEAFPGESGDYALYTPSMWSEDRAACQARSTRWSQALGDLSVEKLVAQSRSSARAIALDRAVRHGSVQRGSRAYRVCYGRPPAESALLNAAAAEAWHDVASVLEEADQN
jgi:hypothetical protein